MLSRQNLRFYILDGKTLSTWETNGEDPHLPVKFEFVNDSSHDVCDFMIAQNQSNMFQGFHPNATFSPSGHLEHSKSNPQPCSNQYLSWALGPKMG